MGLVQGLGEFLPISSSAHLVLVPWFFHWQDPGLTFDVALHLGTLLAVVAYFWRDWFNLFRGALSRRPSEDKRLFWYLVLATIPGAAGGFLLENQAETVFRSPALIAVMLILMGVILYWADRRGAKMIDIKQAGLGRCFTIGLSQALAIIPGVSRSGITMSTGLMSGLTREATARFSFLLSTPIIFGAAVLKLPKVLAGGADINFLVGTLVSAVVGFISIGLLMRLVRKRSYLPFVWYRFALGAVVLVTVFIRWKGGM